jgi:PilZ domain
LLKSEIKSLPQIYSPRPRMTTSAGQGSGLLKRRSSRIALNTSIGVSGEDRDKRTFSLTAKATNLNRHGAAVQLSRDLPVGSTVFVRNKRGLQTSARVVAQVNTVEGLRTYGIEFLDNADKLKTFWGITFPALSPKVTADILPG